MIRGLLADRRIGALVAITFLMVGSRMGLYTFLAIHFVERLHFGAALVGLAFLAENIARGFTGPFAGAWSDRSGRRPVLVLSAVASIVLMPMFLFVHDAVGLIVWSLAVGLAQGAFFPVVVGFLLDLAPDGRQQSVLAINYTALSLGYTLGVAPAGFLTGIGIGWLGAMASGGFVLVALLAMTLKGGGEPSAEAGPTVASATVLGRSFEAFRDGRFLLLVGLASLFPLGIGIASLAVPVYGASLGIPDPTIGLILSAAGLLLAALSIPMNRLVEPYGPARFMPLAMAVVGLSYIPYALLPGAFGLLYGELVFALSETVLAAATPILIHSMAPKGRRGAYQGAWSLVFAVFTGSGLLVTGLGADTLGWTATWWLLAGVTLAAAGGLLAVRGRIGRAPIVA